LVHDGVAHRIDFIFGEVDKKGSSSNHEADQGYHSILIVLLVHEVGFVFRVLFDFLITESGNVDREFLMESGVEGFFQITEVGVVIKCGLVVFGVVGLAVVKDIDSGLVGKLTGDVLKFVEGG
jgi:hypothetical protein